MLKSAVREGCRSYLVFAAGYDTFGIRNTDPALAVFELDLPEILNDKAARIKAANLNDRSISVPCDLSKDSWKEKLLQSGFVRTDRAFGSLLGISYYLEKSDFKRLLQNIGEIFTAGSEICFDYQSEEGSKETRVNQELASAAKEEMKAKYSLQEIIGMLKECGFTVKRQLEADDMTKEYFSDHNNANPTHEIFAPVGVCYCLAVREVLM